MVYWLIPLIGIYSACAAAIWQRKPRSVSGAALTAYLLVAAAMTAGLLVTGTAARVQSAEIGTGLAVVAGTWLYILLLPLALLGLYFESWLRAHVWRALAVVSACATAMAGLFLVRVLTSSRHLVRPLDAGGYGLEWPPIVARDPVLALVATAFLSQICLWVVLAFGLRSQRIVFWRGALPLAAAALAGALLPVMGHRLPDRWQISLAAASLIPVTVALGLVVLDNTRRAVREAWLANELSRLDEAALVIDAQRHVIWQNSAMLRWMGGKRPDAVTARHFSDVMPSSDLQITLRRMLAERTPAAECHVRLDGEDYILLIAVQPLEAAAHLPGARLVTLRDLTASRIRRDLDVRSRELIALSRVSADIASSLDLSQVIMRALQQITALLPVDRVAIYIADPDADGTLHLAKRMISRPDIDLLAPTINLREDAVLEKVVARGQPVYVTDVAQPNASPEAMWLRASGIQSGAVLPLAAHDRLTCILLVAYHEPHTFDAVERAILESVGRQVAVAVRNAHLHAQEHRQRRIAEALGQMATVLGSSSLDSALQHLLDGLADLLACDRATVLLTAEPGQLRLAAYAGTGEQPVREPDRVRLVIDELPYLQHLFETRAPQLVTDTRTDEFWRAGEFDKRTWLGVPLIVRDQIVGCFSLSNDRPHSFQAADVRLVETFAAQAAIAVENTQLFEREQQRRAQVELLYEASYNLMTSPDLDGALLTALDDLRRVCPFDAAHVALLSADGSTWYPRAYYPPTAELPHSPVVAVNAYPLVQHIMSTRQPVLVVDTRSEPRWKPGRFSAREIRSWLGMPLLVRDQVVGMLNIDGYRAQQFTEDHRHLVQLFAMQVAGVIEVFRLWQEAARQNRALHAHNTVLVASNEALTQENRLNVLLDRLLHAYNLPGGMIHRVRAETGQYVLVAASGLPEKVQAHLTHIPGGAGGVPRITLPTGEQYAFYSIGLRLHGADWGLLSLIEPPTAPFDDESRTQLQVLGQQLSVVLDNAALFEDVTQRAAFSAALAQLSLTLSARLERDAVFGLICREGRAIFNADGAYIGLVAGDQLVGVEACGPGSAAFVDRTWQFGDAALPPLDVIASWQPQVIQAEALAEVLGEEFTALSGAQAVLVIPLRQADMVAGLLLLVHTADAQAFQTWQLDPAGQLGIQIALVIQNVTLFDEVHRRLDHLRLVNEVGRSAAAVLRMRALIDGVAARLYSRLKYDQIILAQAEGGALSIYAMYVTGQHVPAADQGYPPPDASIGEAFERAVPVRAQLPCAPVSRADGSGDTGATCSALAVPMIMADEVIGVLAVRRYGENTITQEDLDLLEPLSAQVAISVSNARLFEKVRLQAIELEGRVVERTDQIRQQQERTEAILGSVADAVIVLDLHGRVVKVNPVARALFDQYDLELDLGARITDLVARTGEQPNTADGTPGNSLFTEEIEVGTVVLQANAARVLVGSDVVGTVVVLRDISALKELDRLRDTFVSNVSHELRTPLANLKLYLSLLEQGRPERRADYVSVMSGEIDRLERLITDLLHLSRLQSEQHGERIQIREQVDLNSLIGQVIRANSARAEEQHKRLTYEPETGTLPPLLGNADQLVRALTNVIGNAVNYTPPEGAIRVRSRLSPPGEHAKSESVIIEVADTGIGIPAEELPMIFDRFYRGSNVRTDMPGTGLGLAIIKEIIELHGGTINVESELGRGTTFRLVLPIKIVKESRGVGNEEQSIGQDDDIGS